MTRPLLDIAGIVAIAVAVVRAVLGDMFQEEARTRLTRIPHALTRLACAQLPRELRADYAAEWEAELEFVLKDTEGMPVTRLLRGIGVSGSLVFGARKVARELGHAEGRLAVSVVRILLGCGITAVGLQELNFGIVLLLDRKEGIDGGIGITCMALCYIAGGIALIRAKPGWGLPGIPLACAANIAFYLHQGGTWRLVWTSIFFALFLIFPAVKLAGAHADRKLRRAIRLHDELFPDCTECFADLRAV